MVRAAVVDAAGTAPAVRTVELAEPEPDEALVRIHATGVCHTDVAWAAGELFPTFPVVLGHESAGVVEAVGSAVTNVAPGDRVVLARADHCGRCLLCESGHPVLCETKQDPRPRLSSDGRTLVQGFGIGGFAGATVVRALSLVAVPDGVPLEVAALTGCAVATGVCSATNIARVRPGSSVIVLGCGGIGLCGVMGAALCGAERIVAVDPRGERRALAAKVGATETLDAIPDGGGFDYVLESVGRTDVMEKAVFLSRRAGTVVLIGAPPPSATITLSALEFVVGLRTVVGCEVGDVRPHIDLPAIFRLYRRGVLPLDALITGHLPLDRVADAFERSRRGEGIRTLVTMPGQ